MLIRTALVLSALLVVSACDMASPPPAHGEGFGAASLHVFLSDSTGAFRAAGYTEYRALAPGDSVSGGFSLFVRLGDGTDAEYEGDLVGVCTEAGALTYTLTADGGPVWRLETTCEPYAEAGTWLRLDAGEVTEGGTFESGVAVP